MKQHNKDKIKRQNQENRDKNKHLQSLRGKGQSFYIPHVHFMVIKYVERFSSCKNDFEISFQCMKNMGELCMSLPLNYA